MRKLMTALVLLLGFSANAGFVGDHYSYDQIRFENRCEIPICRASDNGRGFVQYCNFQRQSTIPNGQPVYVWLGNNSKCYCPCDYAFENEVMQNN